MLMKLLKTELLWVSLIFPRFIYFILTITLLEGFVIVGSGVAFQLLIYNAQVILGNTSLYTIYTNPTIFTIVI
jgi:hypothetical protein